jgi:rRNA processing
MSDSDYKQRNSSGKRWPRDVQDGDRPDSRNSSDRRRPPAATASQQSAVGLEKFAHRHTRGAKYAIDKFRAKKEQKRLQTAKSLRSYQKAMKQAGYQPGKGASRKRLPELQGVKSSDEANGGSGEVESDVEASKEVGNLPVVEEGGEDISHQQQLSDGGFGRDQLRSTRDSSHPAQLGKISLSKREKGYTKSNRYEKALHQRTAKLVEVEERRKHQLQQEQLKQSALQHRRERRQRLSQRTRKGQPIMANIVQDILHKLTNDSNNSKGTGG